MNWQADWKFINDNLAAIAAVFGILGISIWGIVKLAGRYISRFFKGSWRFVCFLVEAGTDPCEYELSNSPAFIETVVVKGKPHGNAIIFEIPFYCRILKGPDTPQYAAFINVPLPYSVAGTIGNGTVTAQHHFNSDLSAGGTLFNECVFKVRAPDKVKETTYLGRIIVTPNMGAPDELEILWHVKYYPPDGRYPRNREMKMRIQFQRPSPTEQSDP